MFNVHTRAIWRYVSLTQAINGGQNASINYVGNRALVGKLFLQFFKPILFSNLLFFSETTSKISW